MPREYEIDSAFNSHSGRDAHDEWQYSAETRKALARIDREAQQRVEKLEEAQKQRRTHDVAAEKERLRNQLRLEMRRATEQQLQQRAEQQVDEKNSQALHAITQDVPLRKEKLKREREPETYARLQAEREAMEKARQQKKQDNQRTR